MKTKCDHIMGEWESCGEGGVFHVSNWNMHTDCETWKFCPLCGKEVSKLKKPRRYQCKAVHGPVTTVLMKEMSRFGADIVRRMTADREKRLVIVKLLKNQEK